jgi:hypothetical protein
MAAVSPYRVDSKSLSSLHSSLPLIVNNSIQPHEPDQLPVNAATMKQKAKTGQVRFHTTRISLARHLRATIPPQTVRIALHRTAIHPLRASLPINSRRLVLH